MDNYQFFSLTDGNKIVLQTSLIGSNGEIVDTYEQKIGIRTVTWTNTTVYLNEKPLYLRGFGMHEDSDVSFIST